MLTIVVVLAALIVSCTADSTCKDFNIQCRDFRKACKDPSWKSYVERFCRKTCGLCGTVPSQGPPTDRPRTDAPKTKYPPTPPPPATGPTIPPGTCGRSTVPHSRIIAGKTARKGAWPWMISLRYTGYHNCGGSLISPKWVLTAAHCTYGKHARSFKVVSGEHNYRGDDGTEQTIQVARLINHPKYSNRNIRYDIALMELERPVQLNAHSQVVCLPPKGFKPALGRQCWLSGWGTTTHPGNTPSLLQQAMLPVVDKKNCFDMTGFVCTGFGKSSLTNACRGDSGGPLVCQEKDGSWTQQGVTSFVVEYCKYYTAFTRIGDHIDWIKQYVNL